MQNLLSKTIYYSIFGKAALLTAMAFCGAASPVFGQEAVSGKFTLSESVRLGENVLPSGTYLFTIKPTGIILSVDSIPMMGTPVLFAVRPEKGTGPTAAIFAMASRTTQGLDASQLVLTLGRNEAAMHSMYLDKQKLQLDFDWSSSRDKTVLTAQAVRPQGGASSKATN